MRPRLVDCRTVRFTLVLAGALAGLAELVPAGHGAS
jgi:hypothetical protein